MGWWLAFGAAGLAMLLAGTWRMFAHFPGYDDEGYILLTVRNYLEQGGLYGRVYSQYGPVFYALHDGLHRLTGWAVDHAYARWFTLTMWLGAAAGSGVLVARSARSGASAWFAAVAVFLFLYQFSEEAFHPGAVVVFLLPLLVGTMQALEEKGRPAAMAAVAGAGAATLALLKVNVGVLFGAGVVVWALLSGGGWRRVAGVALGLVLAAGLMHALLAERWVVIYLLVFASGLVGLALAAPAAARPLARPAAAWVAGALLAAVAWLVLVGARGSSLAELVDGVVLRPSRHADSYSFAVDWRPGTVVSAIAALVLAAWHRVWWHGGRREAAEKLLVLLRLGLLAGLLAVLALLETHRVIGVLFSFALPWLWVWVSPLRAGGSRDVRPLLAGVLLLQMLHAYPVGGIQICWGSFLVFALAAAALPETAAWLAARPPGIAWGGSVVLALPLLVAGAKLAGAGRSWHADYAAQVPLGLPGTGGLRLSERETAAYRALATNAVLHADSLFSLPGMFSFNLWTGVPAPTRRSTTVWYALLTDAEQREIMAALGRAERPALVVDGNLVSILRSSGAPPAGPLYEYLLARFRPAFAFQGVGFWVRRGRAVLPVDTAWRVRAGRRLEICLAGASGPMARLVLRDADARSGGLTLDARNCRVTVRPVRLDGAPRGPEHEAGWPLVVDGPAWLSVTTTAAWPEFPSGAAPLVEVQDADGRRVGVVRVVDGALE